MAPPQRLALRALAPLLVMAAAAAARAQEPGAPQTSEGIDDPKLERRLGTRVDLGAPPSAPPPVDAGGAWVAAPGAPAPAVAVVASTPQTTPEVRLPRLMLGYRRFTFAQVGAAPSAGPGAGEPFDVVSLDFFPVSNTFRLGLSSQYGWQEGTFRRNGDVILAETVSLGIQAPGPLVTPFVDGYAGAGLMQRTHGAHLNSIATFYDELGIDVGADLFLARNFFLSAALAYLHGMNAYGQDNTLTTFSVDTWSFKLGVGL
jgi:hypothetical protein